MDRRKFLTVGAVGAASGGALAAPAIAQDKQVVRMVTSWPRNLPGVGTGAQRVADRITAASGGRIEVKLFASGELVPALESFDAVATGAAEMYHAAEYYWQGKHLAFNLFTTAPMGMTAAEMEAWVHFGGGQQLWDELSAQFGVKAFLAGNTGFQMGGWFREPITSLDDLKGLNFRMPGLGGEVLRRVGMNVVGLPASEVFPALQAGAIDGTEWVGPYNDLALGFHNVVKNYAYPGFHEPGSSLSAGVNKAWWDSLDAADRALIEACCVAENDVMMAEFNARNGEALERLVDEHDVKLFRFPDEVWDAFVEASADVVATVAQTDDLGKRVHESYTAFQKRVMPWSKLADQSYMDARARSLGI